MRFTSFLTTLALAASTAFAADTILFNNCDFTVWYAAVDSQPSSNMTQVPAGGYIYQEEWFDGKTGTAIKITRAADGLWTGKPVLNFGYTLTKEELWYDLSSINGYDFWGKKITLTGNGKDAEDITWDGAPGPSHIAHWTGQSDLTLTLCAA
jgi:hypothetical protein